MADQDHYDITWKNHSAESFALFSSYYRDTRFTDVLLHCGGTIIRAHRVVLASCSSYLERVLDSVNESPRVVGQTAVVLHNMQPDLVKLSVEFMYTGEARVPSAKLQDFMDLAENLEIRGLKSPPLVEQPQPEQTVISQPPLMEPSTYFHVNSSSVQVPVNDANWTAGLKRKITPDGVPSPCAKRPAVDSPVVIGMVAPAPFFPQQQMYPVPVVESAQAPPPASQVKEETIEDDDEIEEVPVIKEEVLDEEDSSAWAEEGEEQQLQHGTVNGSTSFFENDPYPQEGLQNIPSEITQFPVARVSHYTWRGTTTRESGGTKSIYFCSLCGYKTLHGVSSALRHERTHTKERPYQCPNCDRAFIDSSALNNHSLKVHNVSLSTKKSGQSGKKKTGGASVQSGF